MTVADKIREIVDKNIENDFLEIINKMGKDVQFLENRKNLNNENLDSIKANKEILYFLNSVIKPAGLSESEFNLIRPLAEKLIKKEQLEKTVLKLFKRE